ncbi:MAG TPA: hypothetical protein VKB54_04145 [Solirubrobacteraceae bacterium]|nr:hypothetical protein [Solirubrobacteraceae bacterium]
MRRAIVIALVGLGLLAATALGSSRARLTFTKATPVTVHGTGFHRHEHVRVTVRQPMAQSTKRMTASASGTFSASFPSVNVKRCQPLSVTAVGANGSHAALVRRPMCPVE